jgi:hypothetical protein
MMFFSDIVLSLKLFAELTLFGKGIKTRKPLFETKRVGREVKFQKETIFIRKVTVRLLKHIT